MSEVVLLAVLVLLGPALMVAAHLYAAHAQDDRVEVFVQLRLGGPVIAQLDEHKARYRVRIMQYWNTTSTASYRATVPAGKYGDLATDPAVWAVTRVEE